MKPHRVLLAILVVVALSAFQVIHARVAAPQPSEASDYSALDAVVSIAPDATGRKAVVVVQSPTARAVLAVFVLKARANAPMRFSRQELRGPVSFRPGQLTIGGVGFSIKGREEALLQVTRVRQSILVSLGSWASAASILTAFPLSGDLYPADFEEHAPLECQFGGPGALSCSASCGDLECSVSCSTGYACCECSDCLFCAYPAAYCDCVEPG